MKDVLLKFVLGLLSIIFMVIPEIIMINIYCLLSPETILEKIVILGLFWFGGATASIICFLLGCLFLGFILTEL